MWVVCVEVFCGSDTVCIVTSQAEGSAITSGHIRVQEPSFLCAEETLVEV